MSHFSDIRTLSRVCAEACALLLLSAGVARASFCDTAGWVKTFADDFEGATLNASRFHVVQTGVDPGPMAALWACRTAMCTADNVAVHDGALWLTTQRQAVGAYAYTSGAVTTRDLAQWTPAAGGTFRSCVSARLPGSMEPGRAQGLCMPALGWAVHCAPLTPARGCSCSWVVQGPRSGSCRLTTRATPTRASRTCSR